MGADAENDLRIERPALICASGGVVDRSVSSDSRGSSKNPEDTDCGQRTRLSSARSRRLAARQFLQCHADSSSPTAPPIRDGSRAQRIREHDTPRVPASERSLRTTIGFSAPHPAIRPARQRSTGLRAAVASSRRRSGAVYGAPFTRSGSSSASRAIASIASQKASSALHALGLRRLDHQRLVDDQREVDRRRVEAVVDQPLGDVQGFHAALGALLALPEKTTSCMQGRSCGSR